MLPLYTIILPNSFLFSTSILFLSKNKCLFLAVVFSSFNQLPNPFCAILKTKQNTRFTSLALFLLLEQNSFKENVHCIKTVSLYSQVADSFIYYEYKVDILRVKGIETEPHFVAQVGLQHVIFLLQPLECLIWWYKYVLPRSARRLILLNVLNNLY